MNWSLSSEQGGFGKAGCNPAREQTRHQSSPSSERLFVYLSFTLGFYHFLQSVWCLFHLRCRVFTAIPVVPPLPGDGDQTISASSWSGCATADALPLCSISTFIFFFFLFFFFFKPGVRQNRMIKARPLTNPLHRWCLFFSRAITLGLSTGFFCFFFCFFY